MMADGPRRPVLRRPEAGPRVRQEPEAGPRVRQEAVDYCLGGAGDERTVVCNVERLDRLLFVPRVLRDVSEVDTGTCVAGGRISAPILVAPMGLQGLFHPEGELATAAAAAAAGLGHCLSTFCTSDPRAVTDGAGPGLRWRQVYVLRDWGLTRDLIAESEELGFQAIVCTVDVPIVGRRSRDENNGFDRFAAAPPALIRTRRFARLLAERGSTARELLAEVFPNPSFTWDDVATVVESTTLPVVVKGILHPDDACRAIAMGAAGVVVSNHGGRQLDRSISSIDALPCVHDAVAGRIPVYFDSGVRHGTHIAKALALGARAVLVGRPVLMALAEGGRQRVTEVLETLTGQLVETMQLVGARTAEDLGGVDIRFATEAER